MALSRRRAVVVGVGSIGRRHVRLLRERGDLAVEVCEPNDSALLSAAAEIAGLPVHRAYDEALASRPDMVVIATPHQFHCEQTLRALAGDIHVLCEKPMSDKLADARRMQAAAEHSRAILDVGFMLHFHPGLRRLKEMVEQGALGTILQAHYRTGSYITLVNSRSRYQATLKGALLLDYAHQPDTVYWLLEKRPRGVYMAARQGGSMEFTSNPNFLTMVCDYEAPLLTTIELNYLQMPQRHEIELIGDKGWAALDMERGRLRIALAKSQTEQEEKIEAVRDDMYRREHQAFLDAIDGKRPPASPAADALVSMEIIDAALGSWERGARVCLA